MARDFQRSRVYKAERAAFPDMHTKEAIDLAECQTFVDEVLRSELWQKMTKIKRVRVTDGRGRRRGAAKVARNGHRSIALPRFSRTTPYILHELLQVTRARARD